MFESLNEEGGWESLWNRYSDGETDGKRQSFELLNEINRRGTTILMVTHERDLVRRFQRRVIEIKDGAVVSDSVSLEVPYAAE